MNLSLHIAKRYLFSQKSHNAINVISIISVCGIIVATAALLCALSVFNGFTSIAEKSFSAFDPDLQVTAKQGKVFKTSDLDVERIQNVKEVQLTSESLEENALLRYSDRQQIILFKGVSPQFVDLANIKDAMFDGQFQLKSNVLEHGVLGATLAFQLGVQPGFLTPLEIFVPKRDVKVNPMNPSSSFNQDNVFLAGIFSANQAKYDEQVFIISIELARQLLNYEDEVSSIDIKIKDGISASSVKSKIKEIVGDKYEVKDRFEQQAAMYKMINIEKWATFLIITFISAIAIFNIVGSLSILILEKKEDIGILRSMGASNSLIEKIFLFQGWLIVFAGAIIGIILGLLICLGQQHFGFVKLGTSGAFMTDAFPVRVLPLDILFTFITVCAVGSLAVLYPTRTLRKNLTA